MGWNAPEKITEFPDGEEGRYRKNDFVLVDMKVISERTQKERVIPGWWNGFQWEGARLSTSDNVIAWRREYGM